MYLQGRYIIDLNSEGRTSTKAHTSLPHTAGSFCITHVKETMVVSAGMKYFPPPMVVSTTDSTARVDAVGERRIDSRKTAKNQIVTRADEILRL